MEDVKIKFENNFARLSEKVKKARFLEKIGNVIEVKGLIIESQGPEASLGDIVSISSDRSKVHFCAEVVGFKRDRTLLMPLSDSSAIHPGAFVTLSREKTAIPVGNSLKGRVIDGLCEPIDGKGPIQGDFVHGLHNPPPNPMKRGFIKTGFETRIKAIDTFTPLGSGQRIGIFAGSGVGKSTLLGMIARGSEADINLIALIGERGRELREFIQNDLGEEGRKRSIIVVSTSDQSPVLRIRAAFVATRIAEYFRDQGLKVLFLMDSVTRFAMAQREIGLAIGEPPTSRGYTPSVFSLLPRLMERTGMSENGSITALYTVLVEGDDFNEPISDTVRGILDGHIILNRSLATANHFPAIEVLDGISRLTNAVSTKEELEIISLARDLLAIYRKNEDLITVGAYIKGSNPRIDMAIEKHPLIMEFLKQGTNDKFTKKASFDALKAILQ